MGYASMYDYCIGRLHYSEQAGLKRLRAGRLARRFPVIFEMVADGRLHLCGVILLSPYLVTENADELLAAVTHRTEVQIEHILAARFPKPDLPERIEPLATPVVVAPTLSIAPTPSVEVSPGTPDVTRDLLFTVATSPASTPEASVTPTSVDQVSPGTPRTTADQVFVGLGGMQVSPGTVRVASQPSRVKPLSAERFGIQFTISKETHDLLKHVQSMLGPRQGNDVESVFQQALMLYAERLEKRKFATTSKLRPGRPSENPRYVPARVKRAVTKRDGGRCTFVSDDGHRCDSRTDLQFDHVNPVSRGGRATVDNIRLRCGPHNQLEADRVFGAGFMSERRGKRRVAAVGVQEGSVLSTRETPTIPG